MQLLLCNLPAPPSGLLAPSQHVTCVSELLSLRLVELGAAGYIKLHDADFEQALQTPDFLHINAMPCTHVVGRDYALARIVRRPPPTDVFERIEQEADVKRPFLDLRRTPLVRCIETQVYPCAALIPEGIQRALLGCGAAPSESTPQALARVLAQRYAGPRGWQLSDFELREVMVTAFTAHPGQSTA